MQIAPELVSIFIVLGILNIILFAKIWVATTKIGLIEGYARLWILKEGLMPKHIKKNEWF